ncbi:MAG TPA: fluoride efflux transporter CrcB [Solirubrobacteraceae bacterium]|nr:fluoride efflux transporter CrcB [Solirubrobacteraceae bacterium]
MTALLVVLCGGIGAAARFLADGVVEAPFTGEYPLGTLVVNLTGSFLLGLVLGLGVSHRVQLLVGTATLGSYTTFSTWMLETHRSAQDGEPGLAWRSVIIALVAGLAAVWLGRVVGRAV